ncbi:MAG: hypothetical protein QGG84_11100, partial [Rhodospirillales bacterium]|nr:hypothetical protein [Rhodospirillales bacterium]
TPYNFDSQNGIELAEKPFHAIDGLSALVFAATTVGLEAALADIPTIRFLPEGVIALNILPDNVEILTATSETLENALQQAAPMELSRNKIFSPVTLQTWKDWLTP